METPPYANFGSYLAHHLLIVMALAASFLPLFGPLADHHFAERQPWHSHIYFDGPAHKHLHSYEATDHHTVRPPASPHWDAPQTGNLAILNDSYGIGPGLSGAPAYLQRAAGMVFQNPGYDRERGYTAGYTSPSDAIIPPPEQPPRP